MYKQARKLREILEANKNQYGPKKGIAVTVVALRESIGKRVDEICAPNADDPGASRDTRVPGDFYGFSIKECAEALCGHEWVSRLHPGNIDAMGGLLMDVDALEASEAVDVTAFANITNVLLSAKIHEGYRNPMFVGDSLVERVPTRLDGEKIAGAGSIPDSAQTVLPGMPFPEAGFGEHFIETPTTDKRGLIVSVTREAIFFDQTAQVSRKAFTAGDIIARSREKRIIDVVCGFANNYKENGASLNTYIDAGALYDNIQGSNTLVDWTDVEAAEILLSAMTDPASGEPIMVAPNTLLVHTAKKHTARRIVSATELRSTDGGQQTTISANVLDNYRVVSSPFIDSRYTVASEANTTWFLGNPSRSFLYMENWPLTIMQAPQNDVRELEQDIVLRVRASERGVAAVQEPRAMVESNA